MTNPGVGGTFSQQPARWDYSIDPVTGNSEATYPGDIKINGNILTPTAEALNVLSAFTDDQIASVQNYAYDFDATALIQGVFNQAYAEQTNVYMPAGGYLISSTLIIPGTSSQNDQAKKIRIYGQGVGNMFALNGLGGTIIKATTDIIMLSDILAYPVSNGTYEVDHIRFLGNSTGPVVRMYQLFSNSSFHDNSIYQAGTGDGFDCIYAATSSVYNNYAFNRDWITTTLGSSRVGCGFKFNQVHDAGLLEVKANTSRGFKDGYIFDGNTGNIIKPIITDNECSTTYNGITLGTHCLGATVESNYFEGGDQGIGINVLGNFNIIKNNWIYPGYSTLISDLAVLAQTVISDNTVSMGNIANTVGIDTVGSGLAKTVKGNNVLFSGSGGTTAGVIGIRLGGSNARFDYGGNSFSPYTNWIGGAGTVSLLNNTGLGSGGTGQYSLVGVGSVQNADQIFPKLNQGAIGFGVPATALTETSVSANVFTPGGGTFFTLTAGSAVSISSFAKTNQGDMFVILVTNANVTFTNGANLKMAGSTNYTPGANGAMITFISVGTFGGKPVLYEVARTAY